MLNKDDELAQQNLELLGMDYLRTVENLQNQDILDNLAGDKAPQATSIPEKPSRKGLK